MGRRHSTEQQKQRFLGSSIYKLQPLQGAMSPGLAKSSPEFGNSTLITLALQMLVMDATSPPVLYNLITRDLLCHMPTQKDSLAPLFPQPPGQVHSHAVQQNSQQHLFKKVLPSSLLSKPKQRGFKTLGGGSMRAAAFPPC